MIELPIITLVLLLGLAAGRITALIAHDSITEPIRHWIFKKSPPTKDPDDDLFFYALEPTAVVGETRIRKEGFFGKLIACHFCVGVWVSAGLLALTVLIPQVTLWLVISAAIAQISDLLNHVVRS